MRNTSFKLGYYTKFLILLILQLLIFGIEGNAAEISAICLLPRRNQRNANQISDGFLDVLTPQAKNEERGKNYEVGTFLPSECLSQNQRCISDREVILKNLFSKKSDPLKKLREITYNKIVTDIVSLTLKLKKEFYSTHLVDLKTQRIFDILFEKFSTYRLKIEIALAAKKIKLVNCGEHAHIAVIEELLRFHQNDYDTDFPRKIHTISLESSRYPSSNHIFLVVGDATLEDIEKTKNKRVVKKILEKLKGVVIDHWNHPAAGGVRLPALEARKKFKLYSPEVADTYDIITVESYPTIFPQTQIEKTALPDALKKALMQLSGPSIEELQDIFFQPVERERPKLR